MDAINLFPRVLIVALGKINNTDTYNNGLFIRNLFGTDWPRENLAQIFSSGNTGDSGFFGHYYCLGPRDRVLGKLFYRLRPVTQECAAGSPLNSKKDETSTLVTRLKQKLNALFVDTGLYELLFRPKLSSEMLAWVNEFKPDVILAQGYNLSFTWLPLMLKRATGAKLAVLTTDDWPKYQYSGMHGEPTVFKWIVRPFILHAARALFKKADVTFAFGMAMAEEYSKRYGREYIVINHSDSPDRFINAVATRVHPVGVISVLAIGAFNRFRYPLLQDLNEACGYLNERGHSVRGAILSSGIDSEGLKALAGASNLDFFDDPGNDALPGYLRGADILFLAEGFDEEFVAAIELSISSKAHLFMFSRRPIIVYSGAGAGVAKYACLNNWARIVSVRDISALVVSMEEIITRPEIGAALIAAANAVAESEHTHSANRTKFLSALKN